MIKKKHVYQYIKNIINESPHRKLKMTTKDVHDSKTKGLRFSGKVFSSGSKCYIHRVGLRNGQNPIDIVTISKREKEITTDKCMKM
jgi:hypothetical protein